MRGRNSQTTEQNLHVTSKKRGLKAQQSKTHIRPVIVNLHKFQHECSVNLLNNKYCYLHQKVILVS